MVQLAIWIDDAIIDRLRKAIPEGWNDTTRVLMAINQGLLVFERLKRTEEVFLKKEETNGKAEQAKNPEE